MFRIIPYLIALILPVSLFFGKIFPSDISNYKDIVIANISFASIGVGFLAAAITLMPSLSDNLFVDKLKEMGAYRKLLSFLFEAIVFLFCSSLLSIGVLFFDLTKNTQFLFCFNLFWSYIFLASLLLVVRVILYFLKFLVITSEH